jgi:hypothetical protein
MASGGMIYEPSLMTIGSVIQIILSVLARQFERLCVMLVLLIERDLWSTPGDAFMWHDIHTKFYEDWYRCSSTIKFCFRNLTGCNVGVTDGRDLWSAPGNGLRLHDIYIPTSMTVCSGIQVTLRLLPQQFDRLYCWYYWYEVFMKYVVGLGSGGMMYIPSFIKNGSVIQKLIWGDTHTDYTH